MRTFSAAGQQAQNAPQKTDGQSYRKRKKAKNALQARSLIHKIVGFLVFAGRPTSLPTTTLQDL